MEIEKLLTKLMGKEQTDIVIPILTVFPDIQIHITGVQGPTGKTTLCRKLRQLGLNAFEDWEREEKDSSNAVYIEIVLNKPVDLA